MNTELAGGKLPPQCSSKCCSTPPTLFAPATAVAAVGMMVAVAAIFLYAPTEQTMGDVQRIFYAHVAVAWCGLACLIVSAVAGGGYLVRRRLCWDHWSLAAAELGWLGCSLALITGSLWARAAWGQWWTWEPRLTTTFILWLIYSGYFLVRGSFEDAPRRARLGAVVAILGMIDLPLVFLATRWLKGMHPPSVGMEPAMRATLLVSIAAFSAMFALLLILRRRQLEQAQQLLAWETEAEMDADIFHAHDKRGHGTE